VTIPAEVECPECGRVVKTHRNCFMQHSEYPTGPLCALSRRPVTDDALAASRNRRRAEQVLLWAHMLRDEDPRRVHSWIRHCTRAELEILMVVALAAINPDIGVRETYGWVEGL
jgi:hypothetical protein